MVRLIRSGRNGQGRHVTRNLIGARRTKLVYDIETKIVYYKFNDPLYGFMSPYIGPNGMFCRFKDNQIVEIN